MTAVSDAIVRLFQAELEEWFLENRRSFRWRMGTASSYERIVSEVLLQRTRAESVDCYLPVFLEQFPSWSALSCASIEELASSLRAVGMWRRKSRALKALACTVVRLDGRFPSRRSELEALPAVGQYVASAILLFEYGMREPLLDTNMARVLERVFGKRKMADIRHDTYIQALSRKIVNCPRSAEMSWAVLDLSATVCRPHNPDCSQCPLNQLCRHAAWSLE